MIILPKTLSGGSNLKTAEALASGRPIVATNRAFDGFEGFRDVPGVTIHDDPDLFWDTVDGFLTGGISSVPRAPEIMEGLLWTECLKPMVHALEALAANPLVTT